MKHPFFRQTAIWLSLAIAFWSLSATAAPAVPLQPIHHVYPDSTLAEIQQAIDTGGTVYLHAVTKATGAYAEYNQVASATPDQPPSPSNPPKGFNIGKFGNEVHIIGVPGPNGRRPRINGGTVVFRAGIFPGFGFYGQPTSFRIENLELNNPDMTGAPAFFSRVAVWVLDTLGMRSVIRNCSMTVTGRETDPIHTNNHSAAVWFYVTDPTVLPSGATIEIVGNDVTIDKVHEGLHVVAGQKYPETDPLHATFVPPKVFMVNNTVAVSSLRGFANGRGLDGASRNSVLTLSGDLSNSIVAINTVSGDARSPNLSPTQEAVGILIDRFGEGKTANVTVAGNDLAAFTADMQTVVDDNGLSGTIERNEMGSATIAGVLCSGKENRFINNHFVGAYPGWEMSASGPGLFWFRDPGSDNVVLATKLGEPPNGHDLCGQVLEDTAGANRVPGIQRCRER